MQELMIQPTKAIVSLRCNSVIDAINSDTAKLSTITKQMGKVATENYLAIWIAQISTWFKVSEKMSQDEIQILASMLYQDYYYLNIADLVMIFKGALKKQVYNRVDIPTVIGWFQEYDEMRSGCIVSQEYTKEPERIREADKGFIALNSEDLKKIGKL